MPRKANCEEEVLFGFGGDVSFPVKKTGSKENL